MSARPHFSIARIPVRVEPAFLLVVGPVRLPLPAGRPRHRAHLGRVQLRVDPGARARARLRAEGLRPSVGDRAARLRRRDDQPAASVARPVRSIVVSLAGSLTRWWCSGSRPAPCSARSSSTGPPTCPTSALWALYFLAFQNLWWSVANLLPVRPLDGGNVVTEIAGLDRARKLSIALRHRRRDLRVLQRPDLRRVLLPVPGVHELPGDPRRAGGRRHGRVPRRRTRRAQRPATPRSRANLSVVEPRRARRWAPLGPSPGPAPRVGRAQAG